MDVIAIITCILVSLSCEVYITKTIITGIKNMVAEIDDSDEVTEKKNN